MGSGEGLKPAAPVVPDPAHDGVPDPAHDGVPDPAHDGVPDPAHDGVPCRQPCDAHPPPALLGHQLHGLRAAGT